MALRFPGRETVSAVKADVEKIKNEFDAILGACNKLIPALENVYTIRKSVDESGRSDKNAKAELIEYIDIAVSNSDSRHGGVGPPQPVEQTIFFTKIKAV